MLNIRRKKNAKWSSWSLLRSYQRIGDNEALPPQGARHFIPFQGLYQNHPLSGWILYLQRKGGVFLRAKDEGYLSMFLLSGVLSEEFIEKEKRIKCGSSLCGRIAISGKLLVSDDCICDTGHEHKFFDMHGHGHYIVPIASGDEVLGCCFFIPIPMPHYA